MTASHILSVRGLQKKFGSFHALAGVDFDLHEGEILGLVGPNGSGKTTCINVITGLLKPDQGQIDFEGKKIGDLASHKLVHIGINRTFQIPKPFKSLTVRENIEVAMTYGARGFADADIAPLLQFLGLDQYARHQAGSLTNAQQKMLDLARALATKPRLLCIDELGAGLNPAELQEVCERLQKLAADGMSLIVVEHLMHFVGEVTDRVVVLSAGKNIFTGSLVEAANDKKVAEVFLGTHDEK